MARPVCLSVVVVVVYQVRAKNKNNKFAIVFPTPLGHSVKKDSGLESWELHHRLHQSLAATKNSVV